MLDTLEKENINQCLREMKTIKKVSLFSSSWYSAEAGRVYKLSRGNEFFPLELFFEASRQANKFCEIKLQHNST